MKGNKVINVADPISAADGSNKKCFDTETSNYLKTDDTRVMSGNLNLKSKGIINVKRAQAHESTHAADADFFNTTINNTNTLMKTCYQRYVNDRLNLSVVVKIVKHIFIYHE